MINSLKNLPLGLFLGKSELTCDEMEEMAESAVETASSEIDCLANPSLDNQKHLLIV